jgi:hypothetical protein
LLRTYAAQHKENKGKKSKNDLDEKALAKKDAFDSGDDDDVKDTEQYTRKKLGMFNKMNLLLDKILGLMYVLDIFSNFIEKSEKLMHWQDYDTSYAFFVVLLIAFFVVTYLPLRYFVLIGILKKFNRGSTYYQRKYTGNKEVCKIEIFNFFVENNLIKTPQRRNDNHSAVDWNKVHWPANKKLEMKLINHI